MTHKDDILAFLVRHPGSSHREITEGLHIHPPQQTYNVLKRLRNDGSVSRGINEGLFKYYVLSQHALSQHSKRGASVKSKVAARAQPGTSKEQQEAERWLIARLSKQLGVPLARKRLYPVAGSWLELDGYSENPLILCEAWAHVGRPRPAQKTKVMADALKLLYVKDLLKESGRCILLFGDEQAASHFQRNSWNAKCLESHSVEVEIIRFTRYWRNKVLKAQERQKR